MSGGFTDPHVPNVVLVLPDKGRDIFASEEIFAANANVAIRGGGFFGR
jgi:hypothetical protein